MGKIHLSIDDKIEERFRAAVAKKKGLRKGNLAIAVEEAMKMWSRSDWFILIFYYFLSMEKMMFFNIIRITIFLMGSEFVQMNEQLFIHHVFLKLSKGRIMISLLFSKLSYNLGLNYTLFASTINKSPNNILSSDCRFIYPIPDDLEVHYVS